MVTTSREDGDGVDGAGVRKYERFKQDLLEEISTGRLRAGEALPSEPALARKFGMSRSTVRQGLAELESAGILRREQGRGTFINSEQQRRARAQLEAFGLILPEIRRSMYPSLIQGFEQQASASSFQVMICSTDHDLGKQADFILQLIDRNIAGMAIVPPTQQQTPPHHIRQLQKNQIPVVLLHRGVRGVAAPCVTWSTAETARMAADLLVKHGHRRIGYFGVYRYESTEAYERHLREGLERHGLSLPDRRVFYGPGPAHARDEQVRGDALRRMLAVDEDDRPTAIFCSDDDEAEMLYLLASGMGIRVPRDLSILGVGDADRRGPARQRLAVVTLDEHALGQRAIALLHEMRSGERELSNDEQIEMPLSVALGQTLGPATT